MVSFGDVELQAAMTKPMTTAAIAKVSFFIMIDFNE
jgi:hypothetical protein